MVKLLFKHKTLEKMYRNWKWTRNNSILLFKTAQKHNALSWTPKYKTPQTDHYSILYQFQCMLTATDGYYRIFRGGPHRFGMLIEKTGETLKTDIPIDRIASLLELQIREIELTLQDFTDADFETYIKQLNSLNNHENLHHGQLIVMFREAGIPFPQRFQEAWAL